MQAIQTNNKQTSDRKIAEKLLAQYKTHEQAQKENNNAKKAIEQNLLEIAENHPEWFEGKTAHLNTGKLKWVAKSKITLPENFDMTQFRKKYPHLVRIREELQLSKLRSYEGDPHYHKFGIQLITDDIFKVDV